MAKEIYGAATKRDWKRIADAVRAVERMEARPKKGRRGPRLGGGGSASFRLAVVRTEAGESTHGTTGITPGGTGEAELLDWDGNASGEAVVEFKSAHRVACTVDKIVLLAAEDTITPGSLWDENNVWGKYIDSVDELCQLTGFGASKILYSNGTAATNIQWGGECTEITTSVDCVDDELVYDTTSFIVIAC